MPLPGDLIALLNACRADPVSDLPRLVLADWLDERDDPARAEFLRVQCELARPSLDTERVAELKGRERALIDANWRAWAGGLHDACCDIIDAERLRQYEDVATELRRRRQAAQSDPAPTVARDEPLLSGLPWEFTRGLLRLTASAMVQLNSAEVRRWSLSDEVGWLDCVRMFLQDEGFHTLARPVRVPRGLKPYLRVDLAMTTNLEDFALVVAAKAASYGRVTHLRLSGANSAAVGEVLLHKELPQLVSLDVGGAGVPVDTLVALAKCAPRLNILRAWRMPLGVAGLAALLATPWGETLHTLEVMNCDLGDDAMTALVRSGLLGRLYGPQLNLSMNRVGDAGMATLAGSEDLLRFGELVLRENRVGDAGVEALAASPFAANLRYLDLWRNRLTDRAAAALAASPHLGRLRDLNVRDNAITDVGRALLTARYGAGAKVGF